MNRSGFFLSCDWGTSSFRLRLVETPALNVVARVSNNSGIASIYELWQQSGQPQEQRMAFYQNVVFEEISNLQQLSDRSLSGTPLIISGMASSTLGMIELPYKKIPFIINGSDLVAATIERSESFMHDMVIISGVRSDDDVMRGEETQLVGCFNNENIDEQLFILPGTHSKHITVTDNVAIDFQTFMTGEVFNLLSTKSILAASVEQSSSIEDGENKESFIEGVYDSTILNPLHAFFLVRTNSLFTKMTKRENLYYLSGLLIGMELKEVSKKDCKITLITSEGLQTHYEIALQQLGYRHRIFTINVDEAMIRGHYQVYCNYRICPALN
jgi:2-dehydro-3-deoxygalactonokinase